MPQARLIEIGSRLRQCRVAAKLSPADAGIEAKCSAKTIYAIEAGTREVGGLRLADLCLAYGVSADYILFGTHMVPEDLRGVFTRSSRGGASKAG
jgi:transcriptional regulator with XRE-family HTH domain